MQHSTNNNESKVKSRSALKDLIERLDWTMLQSAYRGLPKMASNKISVGFYPRKKDSLVIDEIRVRLGKDVMSELGWNIGDRILLYYNPDDSDTFLMVKSENGIGWKISQEQDVQYSRIHFRWTIDTVLSSMPQREVEFECHNQKLIFRP